MDTAAIIGLVSVSFLAALGMAMKDTIGTLLSSLCLFLSYTLRKGRILKVKIGGTEYQGKIIGFGATRVTLQKDDGSFLLLLVKDLKSATLIIEEIKK